MGCSNGKIESEPRLVAMLANNSTGNLILGSNLTSDALASGTLSKKQLPLTSKDLIGDQSDRMNTSMYSNASAKWQSLLNVTAFNFLTGGKMVDLVFGSTHSDYHHEEGKQDKLPAPSVKPETLEAMKNAGIAFRCVKGLKESVPNQDDYFALVYEGIKIIGVFDGHGTSGHYCSDFAKKYLPKAIITHPDFVIDANKALTDSFANLQHAIENFAKIKGFQCKYSGTTVTIAVIKNNEIVTASVGDSKAALFSSNGKKTTVKKLTKPHNLLNKAERKRVIAAGAEIKAAPNDSIERVYIKGRNGPGLTVTRAIGDLAGKYCGIEFTPEIIKTPYNKGDFIVMGTDSLWEYTKDIEIGNVVSANIKSSISTACEELVDRSWNLWVEKSDYIADDITAIVAVL